MDRQWSQLLADASSGQRKESRKDGSECVDRISQLPQQLLYSILSFLPTRDVVRTSALSKSWHSTSTSFPIKRFSMYDFYRLRDLRDTVPKFVKFVNDSLVRQCHHNSSITRFELSMPLSYPFELGFAVAYWIGLAAENGLKYLYLDITPYSLPTNTMHHDFYDREIDENFYTLPHTIFVANRLTFLNLSGCYCKPLTPFDPQFITWPSLQKLHLNTCYIEDQFLHCLTFGCPLIEELLVSYCYGLENFRLSGFPKLRMVQVSELHCGDGIKKVAIYVPSLQTLHFQSYACIDIDLTGCENLEVLKLDKCLITDQKCQHLISKLPALKSLVLFLRLLKKIKISCQELEKLEIHFRIAELVLDAPKLQSFEYFYTDTPVFLVNPPSLPKLTIRKCIHPDLSLSRFLELKVFLSSFKQIQHLKLWLSIQLTAEDINDICHPPFPIVKHLELDILLGGFKSVVEKGDSALLDGLFLVCRPESLLLLSGSCSNSDIIKALCKDLMQQGKCDHCCSSTSIPTSCWRHELKGYQIERFGRDGDRKALTCEALIRSLPTLEPDQKIQFILKW